MRLLRRTALAALSTTGLVLAGSSTAMAAPTTFSFSGTTWATMTGTNGVSIPTGTPYTGSVTYDNAQTATPVAFQGGLHWTYSFTDLAITVGTSTAHTGPGQIDVVHGAVWSTGAAFPSGDEITINFFGTNPAGSTIFGGMPQPPQGLLAGVNFVWMGLYLQDPTGTALANGLPPSINLASFANAYTEYAFGNTTMIQPISNGSAPPPPPPPPLVFSSTLPGGTVGTAYSASLTPATGGSGAYTYSASGLPAGLSLSGSTVSGTPTAVGTFNVTLTATDTSGASVSTTTALTIADLPIGFTPSLPGGTVGTAYSASLSATGNGPFTFSASGLPAGLSLSGSTITGTPSASGSYSVSLTATDASGAASSTTATLTISPAPTSGNGGYTTEVETVGKITAIPPDLSYLMLGTRKLIWNSSTRINVNTDNGNLRTVTSFVKPGMVVQYKGMLNKATNTVLVSSMEIN